ncbi:hypothetical protein K452DRAFT_236005, partial [Aplosporella prunicola CBS 121167]
KSQRHQKTKTYGSWDSPVVTHLTTNQPVRGLCMAERRGCPILRDLWSHVLVHNICLAYN